jgi:L-rhamnose isomerase / sugar isomerase
MAQELYAKSVLVDYPKLVAAQNSCDLVSAETVLQDAFATDVRPMIEEWRRSKGLPIDALEAFRQNGYLERITKERSSRNSHTVTSYA